MSAPLAWWRGPAWALAIALSAAALYYALIGLDEGTAYAGISFLFVTPALLSAFVCALADP